MVVTTNKGVQLRDPLGTNNYDYKNAYDNALLQNAYMPFRLAPTIIDETTYTLLDTGKTGVTLDHTTDEKMTFILGRPLKWTFGSPFGAYLVT